MTTTRPAPSPEVTHLVREAIAAARAGDKPRANALFRHVTNHQPTNEAAWLWFANTATDPADVVTGLRSAVRLNPSNATVSAALPVALLRAGVAAAKANDRPAAVDYLTAATAADPSNETGWLWLAGVTDDPDAAIGYLDRVLDLNPLNAHAKQGIAKLRAQHAAPIGQCPVCEHAPRRDDTIGDVCGQCRAIIDLNRPEEFDRAVPGIDRALVTAAAKRLRVRWAAEGKPEAGYALGLAYLNLGFVAEAMQAFQASVSGRNPDPARRDAVARLVKHRQGLAARTTTRIGVPGTRPELPPVPERPAPPPRPRVMVVDDSATVRRMVAIALNAAGYQVTEAEGAEQAAKLVREAGAPALFLLDVNMPGTDGFGLCKHLRADPETARVPVVFLTGKTGLLSKIHGKWVGAAEYITKPFENAKLLAAVSKLVPIPAAK